jgi:hypothetical protein
MTFEADSEGVREDETLAGWRCTTRNAINPFSALAKSASFPDSETPPSFQMSQNECMVGPPGLEPGTNGL